MQITKATLNKQIGRTCSIQYQNNYRATDGYRWIDEQTNVSEENVQKQSILTLFMSNIALQNSGKAQSFQ